MAMKNLAIRTKVPMTFGASWFHRRHPTNGSQQVAMVDETNAAGGRMLMQMTSQWSGSVRSFETLMLYGPRSGLGETSASCRSPSRRRACVIRRCAGNSSMLPRRMS